MENEACLLCNGKLLRPLANYQHAFLVKCKNCGFVFSKSIPDTLQLENHYTNYPRFLELSPITIKRYNELLDKFETFRQTNNLLDIGCSNGLFLECAKKRGWNVYGTEFAQESITACEAKNIKVFKSDLLPPELFDIKFDIITSFEVIEHINTPNTELIFISKLLRNGGAFYFTTPNFNSLSRLILKGKWNVVEYPEHLSYYTPRTINKLLAKHHFKKQFLITTGISVSRFHQSRNGTQNERKVPISDEQLRDKIENNSLLLLIKKIINALLSGFSLGDSIKGLYIKD